MIRAMFAVVVVGWLLATPANAGALQCPLPDTWTEREQQSLLYDLGFAFKGETAACLAQKIVAKYATPKDWMDAQRALYGQPRLCSYAVPYQWAGKDPFLGWRNECSAERASKAEREAAKLKEFEEFAARQSLPVRALPRADDLQKERQWPARYLVRVRGEPPAKLALFDPEEGRCRFQIQHVSRGKVQASYEYLGAFKCPWGDDGPDDAFEVLARPVEAFRSYTEDGAAVPSAKLEALAILNGDELAMKK